MSQRMRNTLGPVVGYHGCDRSIGEAVLAGTSELRSSLNEYDWLGSGIYFWIDSAERGLEWAQQLVRLKNSSVRDSYVIGAFIHPGLCLNLCDFGVMHELLTAYEVVREVAQASGNPMPRNTITAQEITLHRALDCTVINTAHILREDAGMPAYDSVYGFFEEGPKVYPNSGFRAKTHVQIAVRNIECVVGYFRVREPILTRRAG